MLLMFCMCMDMILVLLLCVDVCVVSFHRLFHPFYKKMKTFWVEAYSRASGDAPDVVVLCNRSLARMKLEDQAGALQDARLALALARQRSGQAMLAKVLTSYDIYQNIIRMI